MTNRDKGNFWGGDNYIEARKEAMKTDCWGVSHMPPVGKRYPPEGSTIREYDDFILVYYPGHEERYVHIPKDRQWEYPDALIDLAYIYPFWIERNKPTTAMTKEERMELSGGWIGYADCNYSIKEALDEAYSWSH